MTSRLLGRGREWALRGQPAGYLASNVKRRRETRRMGADTSRLFGVCRLDDGTAASVRGCACRRAERDSSRSQLGFARRGGIEGRAPRVREPRQNGRGRRLCDGRVDQASKSERRRLPLGGLQSWSGKGRLNRLDSGRAACGVQRACGSPLEAVGGVAAPRETEVGGRAGVDKRERARQRRRSLIARGWRTRKRLGAGKREASSNTGRRSDGSDPA